MATPIRQWLEKATMTSTELQSPGGGYLSPAQARVFIRDAIEATAILSRADVFDSGSPKFEVPKISFADRIMRKGVQGARVDSGKRVVPATGMITLSTELFKGEVPIGDEVFEDNVEHAGLADTIMAQIAEAVGRDLEEIAIKANEDSEDEDLAETLEAGLIAQLIEADDNVIDATLVESYTALFRQMVAALPSRYRRLWDQLVIYVPTNVADGYANELQDRGTNLGDSMIEGKRVLPFRGLSIVEVPLLSGVDDITAPGDDIDYSTFAILGVPTNLKVGFHRRVRVEKFRDPREGVTSFLPTVRFDAKWSQTEAVVLATDVPAEFED